MKAAGDVKQDDPEATIFSIFRALVLFRLNPLAGSDRRRSRNICTEITCARLQVIALTPLVCPVG